MPTTLWAGICQVEKCLGSLVATRQVPEFDVSSTEQLPWLYSAVDLDTRVNVLKYIQRLRPFDLCDIFGKAGFFSLTIRSLEHYSISL